MPGLLMQESSGERMKEKKALKKSLRFLMSERTKELPVSIFEQLFEAAKTRPGVISLGPGEPDFVTPDYILDALKERLHEATHYSTPGGRPELKEVIAKKLSRENKIKVNDPEKELIVTTGSTEALLLAFLSIADVTEEVLVPNPSFLAYTPMIELIDCQSTSIPLHEETGFQLDLDEARKRISPKTTGIVLNSPANPTGTVFKKKLLEEVAELAVEHDLMVLSDEAYEHFVFGDAKHKSIASLNGMHEYVISFYSFSKSYAMPGFRVGYAVGPEWVIKDMTGIHMYSTLCAPTPSQVAAFEAMNNKKESDASIKLMKEAYDKRRKYLLERLEGIDGLHVKVAPEGAFYIFPRFDFKMTSREFALWALDKANVVVIPGTEFGHNGEGFIRLSYATALPEIEEAMNRIEEALNKAKLKKRKE